MTWTIPYSGPTPPHAMEDASSALEFVFNGEDEHYLKPITCPWASWIIKEFVLVINRCEDIYKHIFWTRCKRFFEECEATPPEDKETLYWFLYWLINKQVTIEQCLNKHVQLCILVRPHTCEAPPPHEVEEPTIFCYPNGEEEETEYEDYIIIHPSVLTLNERINLIEPQIATLTDEMKIVRYNKLNQDCKKITKSQFIAQERDSTVPTCNIL